MVGVLGTGEVFQMATDTIGDGNLEVPIHMAGSAIERGVHSGQRKSRKLAVVKLGAKPGVHRVAGLASRGKLQLPVVRNSHAKGLRVTRDALSRESLKLADRRAFVALIAG